MKVLKFGGTSVENANAIRQVQQIVKNEEVAVLVVVSALSGITDKIMNTAKMALMGTNYYTNELLSIEERHLNLVKELVPESKLSKVLERTTEMLNELERVVQGVSMVKELTPKTIDRLCSFGERLSSYIISEFLENAQLIDSTQLIKTDSTYGKAQVNFPESNKLISEALAKKEGVFVAAGFVAGNEQGDITTLGRGGSDYSAAIYSVALNASELQIWTNVDGFMTADPQVISKAYVIDTLSYTEAMELSHFGAKVIYPPTILPVYQANIPIYIKNTFNPKGKGTLVTVNPNYKKGRTIKGISSISDVSLLTLHGLGMIGVTDISMRLFATLAKHNIRVILISQASSENSISVAINSAKAKLAEQVVQLEFRHEVATAQINKVDIEDKLSVVAIVGEKMKQSTGIAGKLFNTIGKNGINVIAIAQGASELNISWVVKASDLRKTLNVVHESFFLSENVELNVFLLGIGLVGGSLLQQIQQQKEKLQKENHLKIKVVGIANSKNMLLNRVGIDLTNYKDELLTAKPSSLEGYKQEIIDMNIYNSVFVDCTASNETPVIYHDLLQNNVSIVTANKVAASSEYKNYKSLKDLASEKGVKFLFETNVGAGLPIINTINDLVNSGDKIEKIEAVLSGTLNYIFNTISDQTPLSKTILQAKEEGYAEPDPRVDLSGVDVMRKLLILIREAGNKIEASDVVVNKFISQEYFDGDINEFWKNIPQLDGYFEKERQRLEAEGKCWRFVAKYENGQAEVGLKEVEKTHPFYDLKGSNNLVMFTSERYNEFPMIIKGYGAGAEVTAAGVFADIIRVCNI